MEINGISTDPSGEHGGASWFIKPGFPLNAWREPYFLSWGHIQCDHLSIHRARTRESSLRFPFHISSVVVIYWDQSQMIGQWTVACYLCAIPLTKRVQITSNAYKIGTDIYRVPNTDNNIALRPRRPDLTRLIICFSVIYFIYLIGVLHRVQECCIYTTRDCFHTAGGVIL